MTPKPPKCGICSREKDTLQACTICGRDICIGCILDPAWYGILKYATYQNHHPLCTDCCDILELQYIKNIPQDQLPIYINENWWTPEAKQLYKNRLGGTS